MSSITWSTADRHRSSNEADKSQHSRSQNGAGELGNLPTLSLPIFELAVAAVTSSENSSMQLIGRSAIHAPSSLNQPRRPASANLSEAQCIVTVVARRVAGIDLRFRLSKRIIA